MEKHPQRLIQYTSRNVLEKLMGFILAAGSTGALVITLQSLVSGMTATVLATGSGVALQVCLYLFARHPDIGYGGFLMACWAYR